MPHRRTSPHPSTTPTRLVTCPPELLRSRAAAGSRTNPRRTALPALVRGAGRIAVVGAGLAVVAGTVSTLEGHDAALAPAAALGLDASALSAPGLDASALTASAAAGAAPAAGQSTAALSPPSDQRREAIVVASLQRAQQAADRRAARRAVEQAAAATAKAAREAAAARASAVREATRSAARDPRGAARVLLADFGWGSGQFSCLDALWAKESGWNPAATNPSSGAFGIPQALPGGKMSSAGADWRTNPVTQIRWGLGYIKDTYGTPCAAWGHSQATNWY